MNGRRYRYYVSSPLLGHGEKHSRTLSRIPMQAIEKIVADRVRTLLSVPSQSVQEYDQIASCITRIVVHDDRIELGINTENSSVDITRIQHDSDAVERYGDKKTLIIAAKLGHRGAETTITATDGKSILSTHIPDQTLLRNLAQAHEWRTALNERHFSSIREIAASAKCDQRYVRKLLRLAYLAPDIVDAILDGRQPVSLKLNQLTDSKLPLGWPSQRSVLGMAT